MRGGLLMDWSRMKTYKAKSLRSVFWSSWAFPDWLRIKSFVQKRDWIISRKIKSFRLQSEAANLKPQSCGRKYALSEQKCHSTFRRCRSLNLYTLLWPGDTKMPSSVCASAEALVGCALVLPPFLLTSFHMGTWVALGQVRKAPMPAHSGKLSCSGCVEGRRGKAALSVYGFPP